MSIIDGSRPKPKHLQNDFKILKKIYKYSAFIGLAPDLNKKSLPVFRTLIMCLVITVCFAFTIYFSVKEVSSLLTLVYFSSKIFGAVFAISCIFNPNVVYRKKWILFVKRLTRLESAVAGMMFEPTPWLWVEIGTSIAIVFAFAAYNVRIISSNLVIYQTDSNYLRFVIYFYTVGFFVLFYSTVIFLKSRYAFVLNYLYVEVLGRKIVTVCYEICEEETDKYMREELFEVASLAEHLRPRFDAAGFFPFNQNCLIMIFSSVINYLVIIIEFDVTVK
ncbi:unnamed protein product [Phyllotreta striolata]|uniref:Gustatory receptor n=1 Tax=Phyllotreta striolata TaxID=444603 RepID=A0A9N9TB06_PHYSR|nr:unnamed protein product [Phyllotreta striolata]